MERYVVPGIKVFAITFGIFLVYVKNTNQLQYLCPKDNYIIIDWKGRHLSCFPCQNCAEGKGLEPPCGTSLTESQKDSIQCKSCVSGLTYSDRYGPSSCKSCSICHAKEKVIRNCTEYKNSICSNTCQKGYYFDNITTHECQPCSYCCNDDKDVKIAECMAHGLLFRQCSIQHYCEPESTTDYPSLSRQPTTIPGSNHLKDTILSTGEIAAIVVSILVVIVVISVCALVYRRRHSRSNSTNFDVEQEQRLTMFSCTDQTPNQPSCTTSDQTPNQLPSALRSSRTDFEQERSIASPSLLPKSPPCQICSILRGEIDVILSIQPSGEVKEGQNVTIQSGFTSETDLDFDQCKIQWTKDITLLENENSRHLDLKAIKVLDFGTYKCEITCNKADHTATKFGQILLDVSPSEGKRYVKLLSVCNTIFSHLDMEDKLAKYLVRNKKWKKVAEFVGMEKINIDYLESLKDFEAAKETVNFISASCPDEIDVYKFLRFAKEIELFEMVSELFTDSNILCAAENPAVVAKNSETPDSISVSGSMNVPPTVDTLDAECATTKREQKRRSNRYSRSLSYESSV